MKPIRIILIASITLIASVLFLSHGSRVEAIGALISDPTIDSTTPFNCTAIRVNWTRSNTITDISKQELYYTETFGSWPNPPGPIAMGLYVNTFNTVGSGNIGHNPLINGRNYYFQLLDYGSIDYSVFRFSNVYGPVTAVCPATTLTASPASSTSINLTWTALGGATSYILQKQNGASWNNLGTFTSATTSTTDTGLTCNTPYSYRMLTQAGGGATGQGISNTATATTSNCTPSTADILANSSNGPITIPINTAATISWTSTNASSCSATKAGAAFGSGLSNTGVTSGNLAANTTFTLSCSGAGGNSSDSVTVNVVSPSTADILANSSNGPITIPINTAATISWTSTNASSCSATKAGAAFGSGLSNTGVTSGNLAANTTFTLSCSGAGGNSSDSVTVNVSNPLPELSISSIILNPVSPVTNNTVTATVVVSNTSITATAASARVRFWSNLGAAPDFTTGIESGIADQNTNSVIAGSSTQTLTFTFTKATVGSYIAYALVDNGDPGVVNETDNSFTSNRRSLSYTVSNLPVDFTITWLPPAPNQTINPGDPALTYALNVNPQCTPSWVGSATINITALTGASFTPALPASVTYTAITPTSVVVDCTTMVSKTVSFTMTAASGAPRGTTYTFAVSGTCSTGSCSPAVTKSSANGSLIINEGQWLQTKLGDFYSRGNVAFNPGPPATKFSSDYLLQVGGSNTGGRSAQGWSTSGYGNLNAQILSYNSMYLQAGGSTIANLSSCIFNNATKPTTSGVFKCGGPVTIGQAPGLFTRLATSLGSFYKSVKKTIATPMEYFWKFATTPIVNNALAVSKKDSQGKVLGTTTTTFTPTTNDTALLSSTNSPTYPAGCGGAIFPATAFTLRSSKYYNGNYINENSVFRWDTSAIPDNATITSASITFNINWVQNVNSRNWTADYYNAWPTVDCSDFSTTPGSNAMSVSIATLPAFGNTIVNLTNVSNISLTGYSAIRTFIDGGAPTGLNLVDVTANTFPVLSVTYSTPVAGGSAGALATAMGATAPIGTGNNWDYTMGYSFVPGSNGTITSLGGYFSGTKTVNLWNSGGTLLATQSVTCANTWCTTAITPVSVTSGATYFVGVYLAASGGAYFSLASPQTATGITMTGGYYQTGNSNIALSNLGLVSGTWYGAADVVFTAGSSGTGALATAMGSTAPVSTNVLWNYTMGYSFTPNSNGTITALGGYFSGTKTVNLWNSGGTLLATQSVTCANTWCKTAITPVSVSLGQTYFVGVVLAASGGAQFTFANPQTATGLTLNGSYYQTGNANLALSNNGLVSGTWYGNADVVFSSSGATPDISVSNLVLKNGSCAGSVISVGTPIANGTTIVYCVDYTVTNGPVSWTNQEYLNQATQPGYGTAGQGAGTMTNVASGTLTNQIMATVVADNTRCTSCTASIFFDYNNAVTETSEVNNFSSATYSMVPPCSPTSPSAPTQTAPANGSVNISQTGTTLTWTAPASWGTECAASTRSYRVYLQNGVTPPTTLVGSPAEATLTWGTGALPAGSTWYWKIGAVNKDNRETQSGVFSFTVGAVVATPTTVFVNGDLTINDNLDYDNTKMVVFIVNGQIKITSNVTRINAYLYAENGISTCDLADANCSSGTKINPLVITGGLAIGNGANGNPVVISFNRNTNSPTTTAAEQIFYDPRILTSLVTSANDTSFGSTGINFIEASP